MNHLAKTIKLTDKDASLATVAPVRQNLGWLVFLEGPGIASGMLTTLSASTLIGSTEACDIRILNDPTVSKQHATIILRQDNLYYVKDLGATNRVRVNSRELKSQELHRLLDNDELTIGCNILIFKDLE